MEIDNYRNFLAIVEAGSMTAASEYIHIAQPALSKQVKSLENYFRHEAHHHDTRQQAPHPDRCRPHSLPQSEIHLFSGRYGQE